MASDKSISSRLLTMKFMQRGILNSPTASPSHQRGGTSKRQRLSADGAAKSRQSDADIHAALQSAIADEEARRVEVMERVAKERGDTRWVLSVQQRSSLRQQPKGRQGAVYTVSVAGFADIDEDDGVDGTGSESGEEVEEHERDAQKIAGRRTYGKVTSATKDLAEDGESADDSSDDDEEEYDPSSIDAMIAEAQPATRGNTASASRHGDRMPTSISGGGGGGGGGGLLSRSGPRKSFNCYKCGKEGHMAKLCPNR